MIEDNHIKQSGGQGNDVPLKEVLIKLKDWCNYLISKWLLILASVFIGAVLGLCYSLVKKPVYIAGTSFVLEDSDNSGGLGQYAGLASMVGIDIGSGGGGGIFQGDNILELYKSRKMIVKTLLTEIHVEGKPILLVDRYIEFNQLKERWKDNPELRNLSFKLEKNSLLTAKNFRPRLQDSVLNTIVEDINKNYLSVEKPDKQLGIIIAVVKANDEVFAKHFDDEIVRNVNDFYIQTKTKKSIQNLKIIQNKTDSVSAVMNRAIYTGAAALDATPNLNITRQTQRIVPAQRSQFTAETNKAILGELVKNLELSKIALLKETPLIQIIDQPVYPLERKKFGKAKGILAGGFLGGFLIVLFLLVRKMLHEILN